jgi:transcriptional regulator with XRE-family HTH domain
MNETEPTSGPGKHPVTEARENLGLTRSQLALACGISYFTLSQVESGLIRNIPKRLKRMFRRAGMDTGALDLLVAIWREQQSREFTRRVLGSNQAQFSPGDSMVRRTELLAILEKLGSLSAPSANTLEEV